MPNAQQLRSASADVIKRKRKKLVFEAGVAEGFAETDAMSVAYPVLMKVEPIRAALGK